MLSSHSTASTDSGTRVTNLTSPPRLERYCHDCLHKRSEITIAGVDPYPRQEAPEECFEFGNVHRIWVYSHYCRPFKCGRNEAEYPAPFLSCPEVEAAAFTVSQADRMMPRLGSGFASCD